MGRIILLLILLCSPQLLWAAENTTPTDAADQETEDALEEAAAVQQNVDQELIVAEEDQSIDGPEDSPGRFIPTEQISQDLGVSFPVDI